MCQVRHYYQIIGLALLLTADETTSAFTLPLKAPTTSTRRSSFHSPLLVVPFLPYWNAVSRNDNENSLFHNENIRAFRFDAVGPTNVPCSSNSTDGIKSKCCILPSIRSRLLLVLVARALESRKLKKQEKLIYFKSTASYQASFGAAAPGQYSIFPIKHKVPVQASLGFRSASVRAMRHDQMLPLFMRGGSQQEAVSSDNSDYSSMQKKIPSPLAGLRQVLFGIVRSLYKGMTFPFPLLRHVLGSQDDDPANLSIGFTLRDSLVAIFTYLCMGVVAYSLVLEHWPVLDALYFSVTTFTTVGYGDLSPTSGWSKAFTCVFGLGGVAFLGAALAAIGSNLVQAEQAAVEAAERTSRNRFLQVMDRMPHVVNQARLHGMEQAKQVLMGVTHNSTSSTPTDQDANTSVSKKVLQITNKLLPSFGFLCLGGIVMGRMEGWSWRDSVYYSIITAGTVGYGDFAPVSPRARLWGLLYIPLSVAAAGEVLGAIIVSPFLEKRQEKLYKRLVDRDLTYEGLKRMDSNSDDRVSKREYVEFMLVEMGLVEEEQLDELHKQFDRLDVTKSGYLDQEDLKVMAKLRRESMAIYE